MAPPISALIGAGYDGAAQRYARAAHRLVYTALARPLVAAVAAHLDGDQLVLDVAAGAGAFGQAFPRAVAFDLAANQLGHNPAAWRVRGDAHELPFRDGAFAAAGCAFGINHVHRPDQVLAEMARVAPVVGVSTWHRPEAPFTPKEIVHTALERQVGRRRTPVGDVLDRLATGVGSVDAVRRLLAAAGLDGQVAAVDVEVPWPGADAYLDYRLAMPSTPRPADPTTLHAEVGRRLADLPAEQLAWRPGLVIGIGRRWDRRPPLAT